MKPGSARLPVSSIRRSRPTRSSISAHSAAVRWSFQRIAGRSDAVVLVEADEAVHLSGEADPATSWPAPRRASERCLGWHATSLRDPAPTSPAAVSRAR